MAGYAGAQHVFSRYDHVARVSQEADQLFRGKASPDTVTVVIPWVVSVSSCCYYSVFLVALASSYFFGRPFPFLCHPVLGLLTIFVLHRAGASRIYNGYHTRAADRRCVDD